MFCGGLDVSININAKRIISNDANKDLIWLLKGIQKEPENIKERLLNLDNYHFPMNEHNGKAIRSWQDDKAIFNELFESKKEAYYKLRDTFNNTNKEERDYIILLLLIINSFGLVEFRSKDGYVTFSCGKGRVNKKIQKSIIEYKNKLNNIKLLDNDFRFLYDINFNENDFVYLDPPYLNTSQYKDRWKEEDEKDLYELLDHLHNLNVKFALSNFQDGVNHDNQYLKKWCKDYNIHFLGDDHHLLNRFQKNNRVEILVTNF